MLRLHFNVASSLVMSHRSPNSEIDREDETSYQIAHDWLMGRINYERFPGLPYGERVLKLDRMQMLAHRLGDPQLQFPVVHVAGTKGKGSTSAMLAAILQASGLRVGLYSSPHLSRVEERFVVDGQLATAAEFVGLVDAVRPIAEQLDRESMALYEAGPTFFDLSTALALLHFQRRDVDAAVLEVGLGGRLDSTNIVLPAVSVITSISFDHTKQLGNTLAEIAAEKAGIIKPDVPVVSGVLPAEPREVIESIARTRAARLWQLGDDFQFQHTPPADSIGRDTINFKSTIGGQQTERAGIELALPGYHQAANAAVALAVVDELVRQGSNIDDTAIRRGLAGVILPARVELLPGNRPIIVDVAHNPASAAALVETLLPRWPKPWTLVTACSRDKDVAAIVDNWAAHFERVVATRYVENPRAVDPATLAELWRARSSASVSVFDEPVLALRHAITTTPTDELVVISGSFFIAGELRELAMKLAQP